MASVSRIHSFPHGFKSDSRVSLLTPGGPIIVKCCGWDRHTRRVNAVPKWGRRSCGYDQPRKQFYLLVSIKKEVADPAPQTLK